MCLNLTESDYKIISSRIILYEPSILLENQTMIWKHNLDVKIDDKLTYHSHIDVLASDLSLMLGISQRIRKILNLKSAKN